ncbi:MAG: hypothetical protein CMF50_09585 [Legionellales bacterium]|nr:hypothetical protein [Legionellales bacterium]|tara:strand:- start:8810 stop:9877 length:1068 start_codon:yes stop_codon:yes gene_type:complete
MKSKLKSKSKRDPMESFNRKLDQWLFTSKAQQAFLEDYATLIEDGVAASKAAAVINQITSGQQERLTEDILLAISQGKMIADGMIGWFPQHIIELIRAGESGGTLVENMRVAAESMSSKNETIGSMIASLTYPIIVLVAGLCVLIYLNNSIFVQFAAIKPIEQWPADGKRLVEIANYVQSYWFFTLVGIIVFFVGLMKILQNVIGKPRELIDKVPLLGIYRQLTAARFMETMGLLISNGVVFKQALQILHNRASPYLAWHLMMMERRLGRGRSNIAEVFETGLVSDADVLRLKAIADAKGFEHALIRLGRQAGDRGVATMRRLGKIFGVILLVLGAGLAAMMVFGIYSVGSTLAH